MIITIYELLGMIKDGKAPKLIKYDNEEYKITKILMEDNEYWYNYINDDMECIFPIGTDCLNDEIEVLEEEKKIPEKLDEFGLIQYSLDYIDYKNIETLKEWLNKDFQTIYDTLDLIIKNQNKLIDYLKSKGDE